MPSGRLNRNSESWTTTGYLDAKAKTLRTFSGRRILLAIGPAADRQRRDWPAEAIRYQGRPKVEDVLARLNAIARPNA
jgi:hypothetical protein